MHFTDIPPEIINTIAQYFHPCHIANLCLVSKTFNDISTPILYQNVFLPNFIHWRLPNPNIRHTQRLKTYGMLNMTEKLWKTLTEMPNLISLEMMPGSCAAFQTARLKAIPSTATSRECFDSLARGGKLRHLVLGEGMCYQTFTSIPPFRNLRTLILHGLPGFPGVDYYDELVEVLISSPKLRRLGLSIGVPHTCGESFTKLYSLATEYDNQCREKELPKLKLENLELGYGYLPLDLPLENIAHNLSDITDLPHLKSLRILSNKLPNQEPCDIDFSVFRLATNLLYISADFMNPKFIKFMSQHQQTKSGDNSTVKHKWRGIALGHTLEIDTSWEASKIDSFWSPTVDELITHCPDLEELEIRIKSTKFSFLKCKILSSLKKLHTLLIYQVELRTLELENKGRSQEFGTTEEIPSEEYKRAYTLEKQQFSWRLSPPASILQSSTNSLAERAEQAVQHCAGDDLRFPLLQPPDNRIIQRAKQVVAQDAEEALRFFVEGIFHISWEVCHKEIPNDCPLPLSLGLKYICVGPRVYSWVPTTKQQNGSDWGRKVVKLASEDVVGFLGARKVGVPAFQRKFESRIWEERRERG